MSCFLAFSVLLTLSEPRADKDSTLRPRDRSIQGTADRPIAALGGTGQMESGENRDTPPRMKVQANQKDAGGTGPRPVSWVATLCAESPILAKGWKVLLFICNKLLHCCWLMFLGLFFVFLSILFIFGRGAY